MPARTEWPKRNDIRFQATTSLVAGGAACGALCVDDRYINRRLCIDRIW